MVFRNLNIYKAAIDYAKQNNNQKIVEFLTEGMNQIITSRSDTKNKKSTPEKTSKPKSKGMIPISPPKIEGKCDEKEKNHQKESEIEQLKEKICQLESDNKQLTDKNRQLNCFLSALKEKMSDIEFINFDDYQEESKIDEGATSSVKIVLKKT